MPESLRDRFLGGAARTSAAGEVAAQAGEVLVVLVEQHPQHPVRRDQPDEPAVGIHHGQAALVSLYIFVRHSRPSME